MWGREQREDKGVPAPGVDPSVLEPACRRSYYRVSGYLPIRVTPISQSEVSAAVFDLSIPDPLLQPIAEGGEETPLMERLRRIEGKLDLGEYPNATWTAVRHSYGGDMPSDPAVRRKTG